jgi:RocCOR-like putative regulator of kinase activity
MLEEDQKREPAKRQHRLLERDEFGRLCDEVGGVSDKGALLDFLHHNGVLFYRVGLFGDRIVLDQNWALEAIYALFDRKKILPLLRGYGRFSRKDLERLIWFMLFSTMGFCATIFPNSVNSRRRGHLLEVWMLVLRAGNTQPGLDRKHLG